MDLNETIRRAIMAGLGAVSLTVEKSKDIADVLVKKGEQTAAEECFAVYPVHRMEPELVFEFIVFVDRLRGDMGSGSVREIEQAFVAELEGCPPFVWDQVCLTERCIGFEAELGGAHHRTQEAHRIAVHQFL